MAYGTALTHCYRGPLLFCLLFSFFLSFKKGEQANSVFSGVFAIVWIGEAVGTMQIKLLGWNMYVTQSEPTDQQHGIWLTFDRSFFQSICIIGYTLFPLVLASIMSAFHLPLIPRIPVYIVLVLWSLAAGVSILGGSGVIKNRVVLALYPLFVFYVGLGCLCFITW